MRWIQLAAMQHAADEHDWTEWFADPRDYRDCVFDPERGWVVPTDRIEWFTERGLIAIGGAP